MKRNNVVFGSVAICTLLLTGPVLAQAIQYQNADGYNNTAVSAATPLPVTGPVTQSGTWTVQPGNTANTTAWLEKQQNAGSPTYVYTTTGYTAYATPTDMVGICGSATKTVRIVNLWMAINSTAAALQTIHFVKRSTADTGGTDGAPTPITVDSANGIATATVHSYTAAPTPGTSVGDVRLQLVSSAVVTSPGGAVSLFSPINVGEGGNLTTTASYDQPITLRGTSECLYTNYAGAALTGGFTSTWGVLWAELPNTF